MCERGTLGVPAASSERSSGAHGLLLQVPAGPLLSYLSSWGVGDPSRKRTLVSGLPHTLTKSQAEGQGGVPELQGAQKRQDLPKVQFHSWCQGGIAVVGVLWAFRRR